ncbi:MAG: enoyl-CoA hydratase/isomerase family protein [Acidobacteriota bacterium]
MDYENRLIRTEHRAGALFATIDNPPINLLSLELYGEMARFVEKVAEDDEVRVLVLQSADPDFFIAHFDVEAILGFDVSEPAERSDELNPFHRMCETLRTMPKATIAKIAGRVGGGGSELASSCDMRFGALGKTVINQMEVALGILPGGSGTQRLPRLVGRGRALEIILGSDDLDAVTAEQWGYLNRALPEDELDEFVERLALRIASFPAEAIALAKASVLRSEEVEDGLREEAYLFQRLVRTPEARFAMQGFLDAGGQTREVELCVAEVCGDLPSSRSSES